MLYRKGTAMEFEGKNLDYCTVNSPEEEKAAKGWVDHPSKVRFSKIAKWMKTSLKPWWEEWDWAVKCIGGVIVFIGAVVKLFH